MHWAFVTEMDRGELGRSWSAGLFDQRIASSPFVASPADIHALRVFSRIGARADCRAVPRFGPSGGPAFTAAELTAMHHTLLRRSAEALFARVVVLFEGETETTATTILARERWDDPDGEGICFVDLGGADNLAAGTRLLGALGIAWVAMTDGDPKGLASAAAMRAEATAAANTSPRIVTLHAGGVGATFEQHLAAEFPDLLRETFGEETLERFRSRRQGQPRGSDGATYDYTGPGGDTVLLVDFMVAGKIECARNFAEAAARQAVVPSGIKELFDHVDAVLNPIPP